MDLKGTGCGLDSSDAGQEPLVGCLNRAAMTFGLHKMLEILVYKFTYTISTTANIYD